MEAQQRGGFEDDGGTDQPARANAQRAHAGHQAIGDPEVGGTSAGAIENQQLVSDQDGLGHHCTRAARTGEPGDGRQEVEKQDNQVAHAVIVNNLAKSTKC
jgi:hypothetical protein